MSKLVNLSNLDRLTKAIKEHYKGLIDEEQARALAQEQILLAEIGSVEDMFGGKSIRYVTQAEYEALSEAEKNSSTITYFITDAVDLSHEHENKKFLDGLDARNITIGNKTQVFDGTGDLTYSLSDIGAAPAGHNHNDSYYTKSQMDTELGELQSNINEKADSGHNHNGLYYTESEMDTKLNNKSDKTHTHDDRYYLKDEINSTVATINANIAKKSDTGHTHTEYGNKAEIENEFESLNEIIEGIETTLSGVQTTLTNKSDKTHTHDDRYYTETEINNKLAGKSDTDHDHDDDYYLKAEIDTTVSALQTSINGKAASGHTHDDRYYTETEIDNKISDINTTITTKENALKTSITTNKTTAVTESKAYTDTAISNLVNGAPEALNTLKELASAITEHQDDFDAYVETVTTAINKAKTDAIAEAAAKDTALHTTISAEIDADVLKEKTRAMQAEAALEGHIAEKADTNHNHDDKYFTEAEINAKVSALQKEIDADVLVEKTRAMEVEANLDAAIKTKANSSHGNHVPATQTANNATFLRNDNTWAKVTPANIGAAAASHGNHVPATQTADNTKFLRNDNSWATVTPANIGAATSTHTHDDRYFTESEINTKIETINNTISTNVATLNSAIAGKANSSHGNHVPAVETANNAKFLRNDNKWATVTPENIGAATSGHDHNTVYYTQTKVNELLEGKAPAGHNHNAEYYTKGEINTKVDGINTTINNNLATVNAALAQKADKDHTHDMSDFVETVKSVSPSGGKLTLTTDKIQTTTITSGTEIVFPTVSRYTEIHLFFDATTDMSITLPDTCRWRIDPNLEASKSYELVAKYIPGPNRWLVNILVYS